MFGKGFLASWNDVEPSVESEYRLWHRAEHMPERLSIPGFTLGRRYVDPAASANRYLTVYEARSLDVFASEAYRARLAAPTPETARMSLQMRNFVRRICRTTASEGVAVGAAAAVLRMQCPDPGNIEAAARLARALCEVEGTAGARLGAVDDQMSGLRSDRLQSHMAASDVAPFNTVLLIETDGRASANRRFASWKTVIAESMPGAAIVLAQIYDLALVYRPLYDEQNPR